MSQFRTLANILFPLSVLLASCTGCSKEKADESPSVYLQPETVEFPAAKSSRNIEVRASGSWSAKSDNTWCTAAKSGETLLVIVEKNDTKDARTATVTVKCGSASAQLAVRQAAGGARMSVSPSSLILNAAPSQETVKVSSDTEWSVKSDEPWLTATPATGNGDAEVTVSTEQNHKNELRTANLVFEYKDAGESKSLSVTVSQRAVLAQIALSEKQLAFGHEAGSQTVTLDVTGEWSVQMPQDCTWLKVSPQSGVSGKYEIAVEVAENPSKTEQRKASVRFNAPASKFATLSVEQAAAPKTDFTVTLVDYNTHNCIGMDGAYDAFRVSKVLSGLKADCIAIQESDSMTQRSGTKGKYVLGETASYLGMKSVFYPTLDSYNGGKYGIGMMSKTEPVSWYGIKIPYTDEQRGALMVEFDNFWYICTHFDAGEQQRLEAAKLITQHAKTLSKDKVVFLAGDLNARPGEDCVRYLREHFTPLTDMLKPTVVSSSSSCIDYIFIYDTIGESDVKYEVLESQIVDTPLSRQASDHFPLMVKIRITE